MLCIYSSEIYLRFTEEGDTPHRPDMEAPSILLAKSPRTEKKAEKKCEGCIVLFSFPGTSYLSSLPWLLMWDPYILLTLSTFPYPSPNRN